MSHLSLSLFSATMLAYSCAAVLYVFGLVRAARTSRFAPLSLGVAIFLHVSEILVTSAVERSCPVKGIHFALSLLAVLLSAVFLAVRNRLRVDVLGVAVAPLSLSLALAARLAPHTDPRSTAIRGLVLPLHVVANVVGEALFALAGAAALFYLLEERRLKRKQLGGFFKKLPPLDSLDHAEHRLLVAGFVALTIGIVTGSIFSPTLRHATWADLSRVVLAYATWVVFASVLLLRIGAGWRGRRAAYGTLAGFGFAMLVLLLYATRPAPAPDERPRVSLQRSIGNAAGTKIVEGAS